jgi:hypothetical protein
MTVSAYEELIRGVNWFGRVLCLAHLGSYLGCRFRPPRPLSEIGARADFAICGRVTTSAEFRAPLGV